MKFVAIALFAIVAVACADQNEDQRAEVLRSESDVGPENYKYGYKTSNGIEANAEGQLKTYSENEAAVDSHGSYEYTSPEGQHIKVTYVADATGFHPEGDHLPVAHPIPEQIARALEYIRLHPAREEKQQ